MRDKTPWGHRQELRTDPLRFFFEVLILENVRSGANQTEADFVFARFALGKALSADHYGFVSFPVFTVVGHFIDARLPDRISGTIAAAIAPRSAVPRIVNDSGLYFEPRPALRC